MHSLIRSYAPRTAWQCALLLCVGALTACSEDSETGLSFEDFVEQVETFSTANATDCGRAAPTPAQGGSESDPAFDSETDRNQCIAVSFANAVPAFAFYNEDDDPDSTDETRSIRASALSVSTDRRVFSFFYDSDPTGGGSETNGAITGFECIGPRLSGVVDNEAVSVFICDSLL